MSGYEIEKFEQLEYDYNRGAVYRLPITTLPKKFCSGGNLIDLSKIWTLNVYEKSKHFDFGVIW